MAGGSILALFVIGIALIVAVPILMVVWAFLMLGIKMVGGLFGFMFGSKPAPTAHDRAVAAAQASGRPFVPPVRRRFSFCKLIKPVVGVAVLAVLLAVVINKVDGPSTNVTMTVERRNAVGERINGLNQQIAAPAPSFSGDLRQFRDDVKDWGKDAKELGKDGRDLAHDLRDNLKELKDDIRHGFDDDDHSHDHELEIIGVDEDAARRIFATVPRAPSSSVTINGDNIRVHVPQRPDFPQPVEVVPAGDDQLMIATARGLAPSSMQPRAEREASAARKARVAARERLLQEIAMHQDAGRVALAEVASGKFGTEWSNRMNDVLRGAAVVAEDYNDDGSEATVTVAITPIELSTLLNIAHSATMQGELHSGGHASIGSFFTGLGMGTTSLVRESAAANYAIFIVHLFVALLLIGAWATWSQNTP